MNMVTHLRLRINDVDSGPFSFYEYGNTPQQTLYYPKRGLVRLFIHSGFVLGLS